jgi:hypothetical protein
MPDPLKAGAFMRKKGKIWKKEAGELIFAKMRCIFYLKGNTKKTKGHLSS